MKIVSLKINHCILLTTLSFFQTALNKNYPLWSKSDPNPFFRFFRKEPMYFTPL